ncbi:MAG: hypothetical protein HY719_14215 [Planctomycetes bacterium]|nr:hypothetical protein [Planctomycetota bacterium]
MAGGLLYGGPRAALAFISAKVGGSVDWRDLPDEGSDERKNFSADGVGRFDFFNRKAFASFDDAALEPQPRKRDLNEHGVGHYLGIAGLGLVGGRGWGKRAEAKARRAAGIDLRRAVRCPLRL